MEFKLPKVSTLIKDIERDSDERGRILSIVDHPIKNVSIIDSNPNSMRSNHFHHKDFHFMYVLCGEIDYFFKPVGSDNVTYLKIKEGESIFTPNNEIHSCHFPKHTRLVVSSGFPRDQDTYEADTVRVDFINKENLNKMIEIYGKKS